MTRIVVSALLANNGQALLARRSDGAWELPSDALAEFESTEDVVRRVTQEALGCQGEGEEFVDTYYERSVDSGEAIVRNVFRVGCWRGTPRLSEAGIYSELRWTGLEELGRLATTETQRAILRDCLAETDEAALAGAPITVITGPAGAGKSTIAGLMCTRLERAAHIEVDLLREMVIAGYASPIPGESDPIESAEQMQLSAANAAALARNFSLAGFHVVIDDTLETTSALDALLFGLAGVAPVYFFTLMPDARTAQARDAEREPDLQMGSRCSQLHAVFEANGETRGLRIDTSKMSKSETVSWILANRNQARIL